MDGLIVLLANILAVFIPTILNVNMGTSKNSQAWFEYIGSHPVIPIMDSVISFSVPFILCVHFLCFKDDEKFKERFVNIPLMFGVFGSFGWVCDFVIGASMLFVCKFKLGICITSLVLLELIYNTLSAMLTFSLTFFSLEILHRKFILPKYYSGGHLKKSPGCPKPTFKLVSLIVYISTVTFPFFMLITFCMDLIQKHPEPGVYNKLIITLVLIFTGFLIFLSFTKYITIPISKLKEGIDHINSEDYSHHIDFVSNDELGELSDTFNDMTQSLMKKNEKISAIQKSIFQGMALMVESRDNNTGGHIIRTSAYVQLFVNYLLENNVYSSIDRHFADCLINAAPMHDLGKIAVDDVILRKPGKFTDEEYEKMKVHPREGANIISEVLKEVEDESFRTIAVNVAQYHHEKWDGKGYPTGIAGEEIPLEARIMALADVYDALVSKRCYKEQFSFEKSFEIISDSLGSHFDPELGKHFLECRPDLEELSCLFIE